MSCLRPLDPLDAEAVASGANPPSAPDAAEHAGLCRSCGEAVERARGLLLALEGLSRALPSVPDLAPRVTRLRSFSPRERRTYALWKAPVLLSGGLAATGLTLLLAPALTAGEQAGIGAAALVPLVSFFRALARFAPDLAAVAPAGLDALSDALARERALGYVALLLLAPFAFGLSRILARARSPR